MATKTVKREAGVLNKLSHVALVVWAILIIYPLIFTFLAAFKSNTEIFIGNPFALPAKDRSGRLNVTEPADLGALLAKINATAKG